MIPAVSSLQKIRKLLSRLVGQAVRNLTKDPKCRLLSDAREFYWGGEINRHAVGMKQNLRIPKLETTKYNRLERELQGDSGNPHRKMHRQTSDEQMIHTINTQAVTRGNEEQVATQLGLIGEDETRK